MDYKVFYRKYRPSNFESIIGQDYTVLMLKNAIINNKISHAYLFTGPRGTGKTSTAKVFAKTINCENIINGEACGKCASCVNFASNSDIIEIDAASNNGVDDVRELINNVKIAPSGGKYKIYIIDEVHMMTQNAFNALLLTLEEPPAHAIFIMATTNVESVPITILSRCQRFNFKKIALEDIVKQLKYVCEQENVSITDEALQEIAYLSEGGMRDALSLLDQLASDGEAITLDRILENYGSISSVFIKRVIEYMEENNIDKIVSSLNELSDTSSDYKVFIKKIIKELTNKAILVKSDPSSSNFTYEQIKNLIFELNDCMNKISIHVNPYLLIQMILLSYEKVEATDVKTESVSVNNKLKNDSEVGKAKEEVIVKSSDLNKSLDNQVKTEVSNLKESENFSKHIDDDVVVQYDEEMADYLEELKNIRINNCFATAKKQLLNEIQNELKMIDMNNGNSVLSMLVDTQVVAAGDVVILSSDLESTVELINHHLEEIEKAFEQTFNKSVKFIAVSLEEWKIWKKEYIKNIKNGVKYELIDESGLEELKPNKDSQLEDFAAGLFGSSKIQVI